MMRHLPKQLHPYIPRHLMPQVDPKDIPELLVMFGVQGVTFSAGEVDPATPRYHQDIDPSRAMAIPNEVLSFPVLLSHDWAILDGNHRAFKRYAMGSSVPYIRLNLPFQMAIRQIKRFPKVSYANS